MGVYLEQPHRTVLSLSPERFLLFDHGIIETKPIKGTRPRGKSETAIMLQELDLLGSKKETAELSMITDLLRNDLAKVSKPGSVKVLENQALQVLPKVIHTYSHIRSEALAGITSWDIIEATFPGGSISGCPKRRAVELLTTVESSPRGIYTGCIGYISDHGRMDLNIAIRTLEQRGSTITAGFGGGIVADSDGEREWEECFDKAKTFSLS
jgi:para-aminobenzoate synthetase component 1